MPQVLASKWASFSAAVSDKNASEKGKSCFAIFDNKTNKLVDFAKDEDGAKKLDKKYNS